jgi:hypothetical protein
MEALNALTNHGGPVFVPPQISDITLTTNTMAPGRGSHGGRKGASPPVGHLPEGYRPVLGAPQERTTENRKVHRVREYWLEHAAMAHMEQLVGFKLAKAVYKEYMRAVNEHNEKFDPRTMDESARNFFRTHTDASGVLVMTLKLSERDVFVKPSKNILKRWNLGNGMLYLFYAVIGRDAAPSGDEILAPFYAQKRVDFVHLICSGMHHHGHGAHGGDDHSGSTGRRRKREEKAVIVPVGELAVETGEGDTGDGEELVRYLRGCFGETVDAGDVLQAVDDGVWARRVEAVAGTEGAPSFLNLGASQRVVWVPDLEKVYGWSFSNGAFLVFIRACKLHWSRVRAAWNHWNQDLGANAIEWEELWLCLPCDPFDEPLPGMEHDHHPHPHPELKHEIKLEPGAPTPVGGGCGVLGHHGHELMMPPPPRIKRPLASAPGVESQEPPRKRAAVVKKKKLPPPPPMKVEMRVTPEEADGPMLDLGKDDVFDFDLDMFGYGPDSGLLNLDFWRDMDFSDCASFDQQQAQPMAVAEAGPFVPHVIH